MSTETTLAARLAEDAAERLLRYVRIDTRSEEESETYPSTDGQLELLRLLRHELEQIGLADVRMDEHGYVTGTVPATVQHDVPTIAWFAHVDTAREVRGAGVSPQRVRYEGGEIVLGDSGQSIQPEQSPELENHVGHDLITTHGTTLLRAEGLDRKVDDAAADLLVRVEGDLHRPVRDVGLRDEVGDGCHDLGDAGLVVGSE